MRPPAKARRAAPPTRLVAADVFMSNYRVRRHYADAVREIAQTAALTTTDWEVGDHRASAVNRTWTFLDGAVRDRHEWRVGGVWVSGHQVRRYALYALGAEQPSRWPGEPRVPTRAESEAALDEQRAARGRAGGERLGTIVVGLVNASQVVCVPEDQLQGLAAMYAVQAAGGTWGEFRRRAPGFVRDAVEWRYGDPEDVPGDGEPVDVLSMPGAGDGDWPWPAADMLDWMPPDVQREFGTVSSTTLNGNYLYIDPDRLEALVAGLEARGYACRRDDATVNRVSGY